MAAAIAIVGVCSFAMTAKTSFPEPPVYRSLPNGEFPLKAGDAFPPDLANDQQAQWLKEAGFNTIARLLQAKYIPGMVELAEKNQLYITLRPWGVERPEVIIPWMQKYADNPYVLGYSLADEPSASQFGMLSKVVDAVKKAEPQMMAGINIYPEMGEKTLGAPNYRAYVEEYVREVNPPYISYDFYPIRVDKQGKVKVEDSFYRTVGIVSDVARESGRPFWGYVLCNKHWSYPTPKEEYIRFQAFSNLAYGAQGLSYFTYFYPDFDIGTFSCTPIDSLGNRTPTWQMVANVNREIHALEKIFLGAKVDKVSFTGLNVPDWCRRLRKLPEPFGILSSGNAGVIVSEFTNAGRRYLMLVNRDVTARQSLRLTRHQAVTRIMPDGSERIDRGPNLTLDPGGYAIFRY